MIRAGLIGCGGAGETYAEVTKNNSELKIIKIFDHHKKNSEQLVKKFKFAKIAKTESDLLNDIDVLIIATPPGNHLRIARKAAIKKINLFIEKPITTSLSDTKKLVNICKSNRIILGVNFQYRESKIFNALKKALSKKVLGEIVFISATINWTRKTKYYSGWKGQKRLAGGGVIISHGIHMIDFVVGLLGKPKSVFAQSTNFNKEIKVEDSASILLNYPNGLEVLLKCSTSIWPQSTIQMEINGTKGRLNVNNFPKGGVVEKISLMNKNNLFNYKADETQIENNKKRLLAFIKNVKNKKNDFNEILDTMQVIDKIYLSAKKGQKINL